MAKDAKTPEEVDPIQQHADALLAKLSKVSGRAVHTKLMRSAIQMEFPGLSFVWVRDKTPHSSVAEYRAMGYEVFELPAGVEAHEVCPAATQEGSHLRLEDTILMYTSKENADAIMKAVRDSLRMATLDQSDLIATGDGKDNPLPSGKESELELSAREPLTAEQAKAIIEARNKLRGG